MIWVGAKRMRGGRRTRERALPKILDPSKRASGLLCRWFLYRKNSALTWEGWKTYRTRGGGPKHLFGRAVVREVFHPPLFSTPPHGVCPVQKDCSVHSGFHATIRVPTNIRQLYYTGLVARAIRNAIRANRLERIIRNWNPYFYSASGRFARIIRISDSRESPDSRESCESIRANHATKSCSDGRPKPPTVCHTFAYAGVKNVRFW